MDGTRGTASIRINGKWVSIPLGTRLNPLTEAELAEAKAIIAKAEGKGS